MKLENLFKAGTSRPILEALSTYAQDLENIECDLIPSRCLSAASAAPSTHVMRAHA